MPFSSTYSARLAGSLVFQLPPSCSFVPSPPHLPHSYLSASACPWSPLLGTFRRLPSRLAPSGPAAGLPPPFRPCSSLPRVFSSALLCIRLPLPRSARSSSSEPWRRGRLRLSRLPPPGDACSPSFSAEAVPAGLRASRVSSGPPPCCMVRRVFLHAKGRARLFLVAPRGLPL